MPPPPHSPPAPAPAAGRLPAQLPPARASRPRLRPPPPAHRQGPAPLPAPSPALTDAGPSLPARAGPAAAFSLWRVRQRPEPGTSRLSSPGGRRRRRLPSARRRNGSAIGGGGGSGVATGTVAPRHKRASAGPLRCLPGAERGRYALASLPLPVATSCWRGEALLGGGRGRGRGRHGCAGAAGPAAHLPPGADRGRPWR